MFTFVVCVMLACHFYSQGDHLMLTLMIALSINAAGTFYSLFWIGCRLDRLERLQSKPEEASP